jgi:hypothetical protein
MSIYSTGSVMVIIANGRDEGDGLNVPRLSV